LSVLGSRGSIPSPLLRINWLRAKRVALIEATGLQAAPEPLAPLFRGAVREGLGIDVPRRTLLKEVVADHLRGAQPFFNGSSSGRFRFPV